MAYSVGVTQSISVNLSASDIGNLFSVPKTLVQAPGTGFLIIPLKAFFQFFPGTQQFGNSGDMVLCYGTQPISPANFGDNPDVDATDSYNVFKGDPYLNGFTVAFDEVYKKAEVSFKEAGPYILTAVSAPPVLTLTSVSNSADAGGTTTYNGTITGGGGNAFSFYTFVVTGFTNAGNNGTFVCTGSSGTTLTLQNANSIAETHAGTATSQTALYTGTILNFADWNIGGTLQRQLYFQILGFTNGANNGTFFCAHATSTTLALTNPTAGAETHAATAQINFYDNQPLTVALSGNVPDPKNQGAILTAKIMSGHSGSGYAPGDTGDIDDSGSGTLAHYTVNTVDGGTGIATFTLNSGGCNSQGAFGYALNQGYADTNQSGGGTGAIFVPQTVQAGNGTGRIVISYVILPS